MKTPMDADTTKNSNNEEMKQYQKLMKTMLAKVENYTDAELQTKFQSRETVCAFLEELLPSIKSESRQEIQINVVLPTGTLISLNVDVNDTVESVKELIYLKKNICPEIQTLAFGGKQLNYDNRTLLECGIKHNSSIYMIVRRREKEYPMFLHIISSEDEKNVTEFYVLPWYTIWDVKTMITSAVNVPQRKQKLEFEGKELFDNDITVAEYNITGMSTLRLTEGEPVKICLFVELLGAGRPRTFRVSKSSCVLSLMKKIEELEGIPMHEQSLLFDGRRLCESKTFASYNLHDGDKIICFLQLRGN